VVNTGEETFRSSTGGSQAQGFIHVVLRRDNARQPWGFRLQGGKDRGIPFQLLKVPLDSIASHSGCVTGDYLVKIQGEDVFSLGHDDVKDKIRNAGNELAMVLERGEKIVPNINEAFPKHQKDIVSEVDSKPKPYYQQVLEKTGEMPGQKAKGFTTVGKAKMATKQYNSPLAMYSEDIIEEIMTQGTAMGKEIDPSNPWNMAGNTFDAARSGVLSAIMEKEMINPQVS